MTAIEHGIDIDWEAQPALFVERAKFERRRRFIAQVGGAIGLSSMLLGIAVGQPNAGALFGLASLGMGLVGTAVVQKRRGPVLRRAEALMYWLARRELVDADGRLRDDSFGSIAGNDEAAAAVAAYKRAAEASHDNEPWLAKLAEGLDRVDLHDETTRLQARDNAARFCLGRWEWFVIGPLALFGLGLLLLAFGGLILRALNLID